MVLVVVAASVIATAAAPAASVVVVVVAAAVVVVVVVVVVMMVVIVVEVVDGGATAKIIKINKRKKKYNIHIIYAQYCAYTPIFLCANINLTEILIYSNVKLKHSPQMVQTLTSRISNIGFKTGLSNKMVVTL